MTPFAWYNSKRKDGGTVEKIIPLARALFDLGTAFLGFLSVAFGLWLMVKTKNRRKKNGP
jgi:hypothetical protein